MKKIFYFLFFISLISLAPISAFKGVIIGQQTGSTVTIGVVGNISSVSNSDGCIQISPTTGDIVLTFNTSCATAGSGDITSVLGDTWITNGSSSGAVNLVFNVSKFLSQINTSIDSRASIINTNSSNFWDTLDSPLASWTLDNYTVACSVTGTTTKTAQCSRITGDNYTFSWTDIEGSGNASWNQSFADTLYAGIEWDYNQSDGSYNITYATFAYNQTTPAIAYADNTFLTIASLPLANRTLPHCSNITGAVSNLCTITSGGSPDFTNVAFLNNTQTFTANQTINANLTVTQLINGANTTAFSFLQTNYNLWILPSGFQSAFNSNLTGALPLANRTLPNWANITNIPAGFADGIDNEGSGNASWNQSFANTLYSPILWGYNQTTPAITYADSVFIPLSALPLANRTSPTWANITNIPAGFADGIDNEGSGNASWNQSYANTLYAGIEWDYNQTTPAISYADATFLTIASLPLANRTLPNWANITNIPAGFADGVDDTGAVISNASLNTLYLNLSGTNANQNINITPYNLTIGDLFRFRLQETIDNLVDGFVRVTGNLNVTGTFESGAGVMPTLDTGQGANELYDMNQNVQTTDHVVFATANATTQMFTPKFCYNTACTSFANATGMYWNSGSSYLINNGTAGIWR